MGACQLLGIINGKIKVGLSNDDIELLAKEGLNVPKVSRRDIGYVLSKIKWCYYSCSNYDRM